MIKSKFQIIAIAGGILLSGILYLSFIPHAKIIAQQFINQRITYENKWEYSAISNAFVSNFDKDTSNLITANVEIIYFKESFDRVTSTRNYRQNQTITHRIYFSEFLQQRGLKDSPNSLESAKRHASDIALAKAFDFLGKNGWEIVGNGFSGLKFEFRNPTSAYRDFERRDSILFKRHVSQQQKIYK